VLVGTCVSRPMQLYLETKNYGLTDVQYRLELQHPGTPTLSKLLLKCLPVEGIDALRGMRGIREPSSRIVQFSSTISVSRGTRIEPKSPLGEQVA
jgi:hypothetical protein